MSATNVIPSAQKPATPVAPKKPAMRFGDFHGTIDHVNMRGVGILTLVRLTHEVGHTDVPAPVESIWHAVRAVSPDALRIGLDEFRLAFPNELAALSDQQLLEFMFLNAPKFAGRPVVIGIEQQYEKNSNVPARNPQTGEPYYNIRLRADLVNIQPATATVLAKRLFEQARETQARSKQKSGGTENAILAALK